MVTVIASAAFIIVGLHIAAPGAFSIGIAQLIPQFEQSRTFQKILRRWLLRGALAHICSMLNLARYRFAAPVAAVHSICSLLIALLAAWVVFVAWYPYPFGELAGGRELFLLVVSVDVTCGPLLTFVFFNPKKSRRELWTDIGLVAMIQFGALGYGMWTVWQARPLYLVHEVDRFKVISALDVDAVQLNLLPLSLKSQLWSGPRTVDIRPPKNIDEQNNVLFESVAGGRDYGARPEFYIPYDDAAGLRAISRAKPLGLFLQKYPSQQQVAQRLAQDSGVDMAQWMYLPVVARQDWVAVLNRHGQIQGFLKGDGFQTLIP